jgi:release factor glutamine methyltransferase
VSGLPLGSSVPDSLVAALRAAGCVFAEDEARLLVATAADGRELDAMVARRVSGDPLEHVLGWADFCGLRIAVEPGVFVPRARTQVLVREAVGLAGDRSSGDAPVVVVDLCCGSGALGVALAAALDVVELHAVDIDPLAVRCARRNVPDDARVYEGDLYGALPADLRGRVALLVANAPYVPTDEVALMPPEARDHEPAVALDGGGDGLDVARRIASQARSWLAPGGHLLIETSVRQAPTLADVVRQVGLRARIVQAEDLAGTAVVGTASGREPANPRRAR